MGPTVATWRLKIKQIPPTAPKWSPQGRRVEPKVAYGSPEAPTWSPIGAIEAYKDCKVPRATSTLQWDDPDGWAVAPH